MSAATPVRERHPGDVYTRFLENAGFEGKDLCDWGGESVRHRASETSL